MCDVRGGLPAVKDCGLGADFTRPADNEEDSQIQGEGESEYRSWLLPAVIVVGIGAVAAAVIWVYLYFKQRAVETPSGGEKVKVVKMPVTINISEGSITFDGDPNGDDKLPIYYYKDRNFLFCSHDNPHAGELWVIDVNGNAPNAEEIELSTDNRSKKKMQVDVRRASKYDQVNLNIDWRIYYEEGYPPSCPRILYPFISQNPIRRRLGNAGLYVDDTPSGSIHVVVPEKLKL